MGIISVRTLFMYMDAHDFGGFYLYYIQQASVI